MWYLSFTLNKEILLAIAVISVVAVAVAPMVLNQAFARVETTCSQGPPTGACGGNSDENNKNRCETTKAGQGQGGEIKDTTC